MSTISEVTADPSGQRIYCGGESLLIVSADGTGRIMAAGNQPRQVVTGADLFSGTFEELQQYAADNGVIMPGSNAYEAMQLQADIEAKTALLESPKFADIVKSAPFKPVIVKQ